MSNQHKAKQKKAQRLVDRGRNVDGRLQEVDGRLQDVDGRLQEVDGRLQCVDGRLQCVDKRLQDMNARLQDVTGWLQEVEEAATGLFPCICRNGGSLQKPAGNVQVLHVMGPPKIPPLWRR